MKRISQAFLVLLSILGAGRVALSQNGPITRSSSPSQRRAEVRRIPVTVFLTDSMPYPNTTAAILRRPDAAPHDVIVMKRTSATGTQLMAALRQLDVLRSLKGDTAKTAGIFRVSGASGSAGSDTRATDQIVSRLRSAPITSLAGVGAGSAAEVFLPSKAMRETRRSTGHY
jgi:hypothetical protein